MAKYFLLPFTGSAVLACWLGWRFCVEPSTSSVTQSVMVLTPAEARQTWLAEMLTKLLSNKNELDARTRSASVAARQAGQKPASWIMLGDALMQRQRETQDASHTAVAKAAYEQALELDPRSASAMAGLAWYHSVEHQFNQSIAWAEKALALQPELADAWGTLSDARSELGDAEGALEACQKMMDLRPDLSSWSRGAHLLWLAGDASRAQWLMEKAIQAGGPRVEHTAWCRAKLAEYHFHRGTLAAASQVLEPALGMTPPLPASSPVWLVAGRIAMAKGDTKKAREHLQRAAEHNTSHEAAMALAELAAAAGEENLFQAGLDKLEAVFREHVAQGAPPHLGLAAFLAEHGRSREEVLRCVQAKKLTRNVQEADHVAWALFHCGKLSEALPLMKMVCNAGLKTPEIHYHAGSLAEAAGDHNSSRKHFQTALNLNPFFHPIYAAKAQQGLDQEMPTAAAKN